MTDIKLGRYLPIYPAGKYDIADLIKLEDVIYRLQFGYRNSNLASIILLG